MLNRFMAFGQSTPKEGLFIASLFELARKRWFYHHDIGSLYVGMDVYIYKYRRRSDSGILHTSSSPGFTLAKMDYSLEDAIADVVAGSNSYNDKPFHRLSDEQLVWVHVCRICMQDFKNTPQLVLSPIWTISILRPLIADLRISGQRVIDRVPFPPNITGGSNCWVETTSDRVIIKTIEGLPIWPKAQEQAKAHRARLQHGNTAQNLQQGSGQMQPQTKAEAGDVSMGGQMGGQTNRDIFFARCVGRGVCLHLTKPFYIILPDRSGGTDEHDVQFWKRAKMLTQRKTSRLSAEKQRELKKLLREFFNSQNYTLDIARTFDPMTLGGDPDQQPTSQSWGTYVKLNGLNEAACQTLKDSCLKYDSQWHGGPLDWCARYTLRELATMFTTEKRQGQVCFTRNSAKFDAAFGSACAEYLRQIKINSDAINEFLRPLL